MELTRSLTNSERQQISARIARLDANIEVRDPRQLERAVTGMLLSFPSGRAADDAELVVAAYVNTLSDLPAWAVNEAAKRWARGQGGSNSNPAFPPSAAQLHQLATMVVGPVRAEAAHLRRLLAAVSAPPAKQITREHRQDNEIAAQATRAREGLARRAADLGLDPQAALAEIPNREHPSGFSQLDAQLKSMIG